MSNLYANLKKDINRFFYQPAGPLNLGISRFLYYGIIFFIYLGTDFSHWGKMPEVLWYPIFFFDFFSIPVLSPVVLEILGIVWLISIMLCSVGFHTRLNTVLSFVIGLYLFGLVNSFAKTSHVETLMLLILAIMAFSKCGDGFSVDSILKKRKKSGSEDTSTQSFEYTWPLSLIKVMFVFLFCAAGLSKLRNSGLHWFTSDFFSSLLINKGFTGDRSMPLISWLPFWLGSHPKLCHFLAGTALFLEILAPLALINNYLRVILIPSLFLLVCGFWIVLGIPFPQLLASFVFWIPWNSFIRTD